MKWKTIESAPRDGTEILGWSKRHGIHVGMLANYKKPEMPLKSGKWFQPTHWMSLPEPPNTK